MQKSLLFLSSLCLVLTACDHSKTAEDRKDRSAPNNTARNAEPQLTADDQLENEVDRTLSQQIRQALVADDNLSTDAKNIKIITIHGVVTLRGVVPNENEKNEIARKAKTIAGIKSVDNQLEIVHSS
jgi:osmotically-inducible protein OsmY